MTPFLYLSHLVNKTHRLFNLLQQDSVIESGIFQVRYIIIPNTVKGNGTHNGVPALVSSAQFRVGRVLHVDHPAPHQDCQPCEEQVLHPHKGDPSLGNKDANNQRRS